ncbi:MAG: LysR family transcriptional regulator [Rhodobacteraceae bacterium]|nr:LysR family transcriptional regulator [Paracoccaceae bacterium]
MSGLSKKKGLPPLDWLKVFEAAGRHGNFTAAAQELGSTQAAVSQRIRNLEEWLGRPLFIRAARGVSLTVEGESYLPLVRDTLRRLEQGTQDLFGKSPGEIRLASLSSHLDTLVLPRLEPFVRDYPNLRLVMDSVPLRSAFDEGGTALQVRYGRGSWPGRQAALLHAEVLQPMMAASTCAENWLDQPAIELRGERPGWSEWVRKTGATAPEPGLLSVDSMGHALRAARLGQGIVLGSRVLARYLLASDQLILLKQPALECEDGYWLTWPESFTASKKRRRLLDRLVEALRTE